MNFAWVLLVMLNGVYDRPHLTTQGFNDLASCVEAREWVVKHAERTLRSAICLPTSKKTP